MSTYAIRRCIVIATMEVRGRARRHAARRQKSEWKVNLGSLFEIPLAAMAAGK